MTTTYDEEELLERLEDLDRCECEHQPRPGRTQRCPSGATHSVVVVCRAEGCEDPAEVYLLCRECMSTWRRRMPRRLRITPL